MKADVKLLELLRLLDPDIAILPECANEEILRAKSGLLMPESSMTWLGRYKHKGLAVLGLGEYTVQFAPNVDPRLEWVAPIEVSGPVDFRLLAVWASNHRAEVHHPDDPDCPQPAMALAVYRDWVAASPTVMAGDFNHNVFWDRPTSRRNHQRTLQACQSAGLVSAYHEWFRETQGFETRPTHYWRDRTADGPRFHIDYVFIPSAWTTRLRYVEVGAFDPWIMNWSDHVPVVVDIALPPAA